MVQFGARSESVPERGEECGFVEVLFARSMDEAVHDCTLLEQYSIPARVEVDPTVPSRSGVAVLVPPSRLVDASEILSTVTRNEDEDDGEFDEIDDEEEDEDGDFDQDDDLNFDEHDPDLDDEDEEDEDLFEDDGDH